MKALVGTLLLCNGPLGYLLLINQTHGIRLNHAEDTKSLALIVGEEPETMPFTLYIFFHADGICRCLEDWPHWVDLYAQHGGLLAIKGIFNGTDRQKYLDFGKGMGLPFPLYEDPGNYFRSQMNVPPNSITKILVGPSGIVFADSNQESPKDQRYFIRRLEDHLSRWSQ